MSDQQETQSLIQDTAKLKIRLSELRSAAALPDADSGPLLEAALVELELAVAALGATGDGRASAEARSEAAESERRMLRTVFQDAPVPLFLLERDGTVRRVNRQAGALLGSSAGYLTGKPFPVFCDMATRAAVGSHIAGVFHSGQRRRTRVRFLSKHGPVFADVTLARIWVSGEPEPLVVAATAPATKEPDAQEAAPEVSATDDAVATVVHRMDVLATATGMLLEDDSLTESVAVRRSARLLAAELADWVIVDVERNGTLRRQVVMGPDDERRTQIARMLENVHPGPGSLPSLVYDSGQSVLQAHIDDLRTLGTTEGDLPVCGLMEASSLICVPLDDGERTLGTLTLTVSGEQGPFDLMDLGLVERLARNLALVIRTGRRYRRRTEVTERLRAGLLPRELPAIPGTEVSARYVVATRDGGFGGDFYDVFPTAAGWGVALGDVCGKGEDATAVNAGARHGIRILGRWNAKPDEVLSMVNETLLDHEGRFVTAVMACVEPRDDGLSVMIGSAGHPPAVLIRRDGLIRTLSGGGIPLGLFPADDFEVGVESLDLEPGDTLFLYSDGVVESSDAMRNRFGHERLVEILAAHADGPVADMPLAVEHALIEFCGGELRDDVSMLALRVTADTGGRIAVSGSAV
ncbi:SpoIIE family protein phosphatase [Actinoallomurus soli]|uniref:SpoIIE family protein phosphatase n=1 Tax=Actinoallomurus soli TaxID=2952535 RepID=UPI002092EAD3|nr:SpoIIE family protein phosphatase [Actinoallomurus soli]MCO5974663.1 SpoIIE family protein phosphatase [Actinoallomurus soli]